MSTETADVVADDFDVDVTRVNAEDFEKKVASDGRIPPGFYMAFLNGAVRGQTKGDPDANPPKPARSKWTLTFKIVGGDQAGREVEGDLLAPLGNKAMEQRVILFKSRLGLIKRTADGKAFEPVPGKVDFMDCTDAKVIIHVKERKYKKDDGTEGVGIELDFNGVHYHDDPKAMEKIGKVIDSKADAASGTTAKAEPAKKKFDPTTDL